jgi:hypothetical protein
MPTEASSPAVFHSQQKPKLLSFRALEPKIEKKPDTFTFKMPEPISV